MNFKTFINLYDNWNGKIRVNNNDLKCVAFGDTYNIVSKRTDLYDMEVIAFGFYDDELTIRVK